jgi:hypothetical protein
MRMAERRRRWRRSLRIGFGWILGPLAVLLCLRGADLSVGLAARRALDPIVSRDALVAARGLISPEMARYLASYDVIALGEGRHQVTAYEQAVIDITVALQPLGARQLLLEMPHAYDREMNAYVMGETRAISSILRQYSGRRLDAVRALNASLPPEERVAVRAIDMNGALSLYTDRLNEVAADLAREGAPIDVLAPVLGRQTAGADAGNVDDVCRALEASESELVAAWGRATYDLILEMTWVQARSIQVIGAYAADEGLGRLAREELIMDLVERRLGETDGKTLLHLGGNHVQRQHLMGASNRWLGGYLAEESPMAAGRVLLLYLTAALGCYQEDGRTIRFDIARHSSPAELLNTLGAIARERDVAWQAALLPLDDPHWSATPVEVDYGGVRYTHVPKEQFDGYLLLRRVDCP